MLILISKAIFIFIISLYTYIMPYNLKYDRRYGSHPWIIPAFCVMCLWLIYQIE